MVTLGVGIDLVEVQRVRAMLERKGDYPLDRLLTPGERDYCRSRPDPVPHVAARLAAKEAAYKSLQLFPGARGVGWRELEVSRSPEGVPSLALHGRAARVAEEQGVTRVLLSLSHTPLQATAIVVLLGLRDRAD